MNIEEVKHKAEEGDAVAQFDLGMSYLNGDGIEKSPEKAVEWLTKSAEQGDQYAQFNLALCYHKGTYGVPFNYEKASHWYLQCSLQGGDLGVRAMSAHGRMSRGG